MSLLGITGLDSKVSVPVYMMTDKWLLICRLQLTTIVFSYLQTCMQTAKRRFYMNGHKENQRTVYE